MTQGSVNNLKRPACILLLFISPISDGQVSWRNLTKTTPMNLDVVLVKSRSAPYADFCRHYPVQCEMKGAHSIELTPSVWALMNRVNQAVNQEIIFEMDNIQYQQEEYWTLPESGRGDCEDNALEKRNRLVTQGLPAAALRLAIVFHQKSLFSHALLTAETNLGTYILDSYSKLIHPWSLIPYNFESREMANGQWERYDQSAWTYKPTVGVRRVDGDANPPCIFPP